MNTSTPICARSKGQRMKAGERRTAKRLFLESYAAYPRTGRALQKANISRSALYQWLKADPRFKAKFDALQAAHFESWYFCPGALNDPDLEPKRKQYLKQKRAGQRLICYYQKRQALR